ncbi:MAG: hypothetical protein GX349_05840 [Firmicutes bacterium]|nr:hypothetical protein [Bacillota bacterium]
MVISALLLVPVVILIFIIFLLAGNKINSLKEGGLIVRNIYLYMVLFATLMMTIGGSVSIFMAAADIIAPTPYYQTLEDYKSMMMDRAHYENEGTRPTQEDLERRYEAAVLSHKQNQAARATNILIKSFGWVLIPLPVFIYFQRALTKKEEKYKN